MFNFDEFQNYVKENIAELLAERGYEVAHVSINTVTKNNNTVLHGLVALPEGANVTPTIYLEGYYDEYRNGAQLSCVMTKIADVTAGNMVTPPEFQTVAEDFHNFEFVRNNIFMVAVNTFKNKELLKHLPHTEKEDISFIYKVMLPTDREMATIVIRNEHLAMWGGVPTEQLHDLAVANTKVLLPPMIQSMDEIMKEMMPLEFAEEMLEELERRPADEQMWVISNEKRTSGAVYMFDEEVLSSLAEQLGTDLYLLPSSIHEGIALSTKMGTPEYLSEMVREVNAGQVAPDEQLSDHVYFFNAATRELSLADTTIEQIREEENRKASEREHQENMQRNHLGNHR